MSDTSQLSFPRTLARPGWQCALILALLFLYAGGPPPGENEAHYLAKAKHYWDDSWCDADLFLNSADPHLTFYWLCGWLTRFFSLSATAWIGRLGTWTLWAIAWQRLSWSLVPRPHVSILTAALFLLLNDQFHLAGEWVVGGVEAKSLAYPLVVFGLRDMIEGRWRAVWLWLGGASALHVLVGGWSVVGVGCCWLLSGEGRLPLRRMWPALIAGGVLSLPGLVPALWLSRGVPPELAERANWIYVFGRLSHHLVFHDFATRRIVLFGLLATLWAALSWYLRGQRRWGQLNRFAAASLGMSAIGVLLDLVLRGQPALAATLLRYYWFRLADFAVPLVTALGIPLGLIRLTARRPAAARAGWFGAAAAAALFLGGQSVTLQLDFRPGAVRQSRPVRLWRRDPAMQRYRAWRDVCRWVEFRTPNDSRFLTPRTQQTFKWFAQRAELASWKDIPQDAESIIEWWRRLEEVYTPTVIHYGLGSWSDNQLRLFAQRYDLDYILVDRGRTNRRLGLQRVYPATAAGNRHFEVYRFQNVRPVGGERP